MTYTSSKFKLFVVSMKNTQYLLILPELMRATMQYFLFYIHCKKTPKYATYVKIKVMHNCAYTKVLKI